MEQIMIWLKAAAASGGFWLPIALIASIVVVQKAKKILKPLIAAKYHKLAFFALSFAIGYGSGYLLLTGADAAKWAIIVGLTNPVIYAALSSWAQINDKTWILSILKQAPVKKNESGKWVVDDVQGN